MYRFIVWDPNSEWQNAKKWIRVTGVESGVEKRTGVSGKLVDCFDGGFGFIEKAVKWG